MLRSRSLRFQLLVPYVALLLGLAATIGVLSYVAGSRAVETVADHLLGETVERIRQAVDRHIVGSAAVLEAAFPDGMPASDSIEQDLGALRTRFWIATTLHIDPNNYVYYGNRAGQSVGLFRHSLSEGEWRIKLQADEPRSRFRFHGIDGPLVFESRETRLFDPRERPWYRAAASATTETWTAVYIDFNTRDLVATRARKVMSTSGAFAGVVATDVSLRALNDFVRNLRVSPRGFAYIVEPDGSLIASSVGSNVSRDSEGAGRRVNADTDPLLARIQAQLQPALAGGGPAGETRRMRAIEAPDGELVYVAFDRIYDRAGLNWYTVVAVPRSDFMQGVTQNVVRTILLSLLAALAAVALGLRILNRIARDLRRVSLAARRMGEGEPDSTLGIARADEIGDLARSFETMRERLATDRLTGLANREQLMREIDREIGRYAVGHAAPFALFFIDLNRFKRLNDERGHAVGDRALQEIGTRLQQSVRAGDLVARYAGDEFVVMLRSMPGREAADAVRRHLQAALRTPILVEIDAGPETFVLDGAIGDAYFPGDASDASGLLKIADTRMYSEKARASRPELAIAG